MTLNLKRTVESGHVRQNFSHGRSKSVLVEKKKKRAISAPDSSEATGKDTTTPTKDRTSPAKTKTTDTKSVSGQQRSGVVLRELSDDERHARAKALASAKIRQAEEGRQVVEAEKQAQLKAEEEKRLALQQENDALKSQSVAEELREKTNVPKDEPKTDKPVEEEQKAEIEEIPEQLKSVTEGANKEKLPSRSASAKREIEPEDEASQRPDARSKKSKGERQPSVRRESQRRVKGKLTISNALEEGQRERSLASLRRKRERLKKQLQGTTVQEKISREVIVPEAITIQELANRMAERAVDVIKYLMAQGQMHKINDLVDADTAQIIAEEFGHTVKRVAESDVEEGFIGEDDDDQDLQTRPPVVTIMGHVDHGKTSLLDALRETNVVSGEAGGITQHIGAYQIVAETGQKITFIDTPGHEAFTSMRARGAKVTDIVVLVVAADDGVMPQTVEAINHAKAGNVPLIVAINKMDKPEVDPNRVRTELLQHDIVVESMSGDVLDVEVSAVKKTNLDKLVEAILLQSEILELKANPNRSAEGVIVEAKLERGRGPVGTALIQRGTLAVGDIVVAGSTWGKVRALINDRGEQVDRAGPSEPVEILGFDGAPEAGDQLAVVENEARARDITAYRLRKRREVQAAGLGSGMSLEQMMSQLKDEGRKEFPLVVKGDVQGSIEAIGAALENLGNEEVQARIVHCGVGGIIESDVSLAAASGAPIVGFNVRANSQAKALADRENIEIRYYSIIYDLINDIKAAMSGLLSPELRETFLGNSEILEVFNISKVGKVAGCLVTEGHVERGANVRLIRDNVVIHEGKLSTLKRFKDEVKEVQGGQECGMAFENYQDMRVGDVIECFHLEEIKRTL